MRERRRCRSVLAGGVVAAMILGMGPAWSKGSRAKDGPPALWIAADRVVGFVPFTVSLYGKVLGTAEPARLELCREQAMQTDVGSSHGGGEDPMAERADRNTALALMGVSRGRVSATSVLVRSLAVSLVMMSRFATSPASSFAITSSLSLGFMIVSSMLFAHPARTTATSAVPIATVTLRAAFMLLPPPSDDWSGSPGPRPRVPCRTASPRPAWPHPSRPSPC